MIDAEKDIRFMHEAIDEAKIAAYMGEVPIGCVITKGDLVIARTHNLRENRNDPTAHAEVLALRAAGAVMGGRRLGETTLYVTLEPCPMCMSAIMLSGICRLVFGASDPEFGAVNSHWNMAHDPAFKHDICVTGGVEVEICSDLIMEFFESARSK